MPKTSMQSCFVLVFYTEKFASPNASKGFGSKLSEHANHARIAWTADYYIELFAPRPITLAFLQALVRVTETVLEVFGKFPFLLY